MANITKTLENLTRRGFQAHYFATSAEANAYLVEALKGQTVGMGGTMTAKEMGLNEALTRAGIQVISHWAGFTAQEAAQAQAYISSVNGAAETGELINIDGTGNRVASTIFGHQCLYLVFGTNKLEPDFEKALWRARNIAGPKNAQRLGKKTPCAEKGDRCYDCNSPERICRALSVLWGPPKGFEKVEVIIVGENLGI